MKFEIKEFKFKTKPQSKYLELLFILAIPFVLIYGLLVIIFHLLVIFPIQSIYNLFSKKKDKTPYSFENIFENEKITIERKFVYEFEDGTKVYDDDFQVFKSSPELELFKDRYFDYNFFEIENGIFLISFNEKNEGMSLWFLDKNTLEYQKVRDIILSDWHFKEEENKIILSGITKEGEIKLEINLQ
ncbi:MAG: hypothetical protein QM564_09195 [Bergeyella sp.]